MRKFLRNQCVELLNSVLKGVRHALEMGGETNGSVLCDCIEALQMIESVLKQHLSEVRYEFYCELIFRAITCLEKTPVEDIVIALNKIINELKNESEVKFEVAFFPYKASMWDSLESVWMAVDADPRCNAVVVPIPYCDRNPDGSAAKWYYEGDLLPDYVPVTHHNNYDLSVALPDIAYFHNPYDGNNYVTSVDPKFYSHEIKKHIGKLVYVPYYVSPRGNTVNYNSCVLNSGADIIVAYNQTDFHTYRQYRKDKEIAVLGSPKIDRVLRLDREKPDIPEAWKSVLEGKKVFLLLTTVSTILAYDQFGKKLRKIISLFESRKDIALIWRPHPLSASTIGSMRPQLLKEYLDVERLVAASDFGVVDHTADIELSMALSDAFIGSWASSTFYMYSVTGKPMCNVNFENVDEYSDAEINEAMQISYINGFAIDGDVLWSTYTQFNGLCKVNINTGDIEYVCAIPREFNKQTSLFLSIIKLDNKLLISPNTADAFVIYDIDSENFTFNELPEEAKANSNFGGGREYKNYIYFFPILSRAIARFNKLTEEFEYFYDWYDKISPYIKYNNEGIFGGGCIVGDSMFLNSMQSNIMAQLSLDTMEITIHKIGDDENQYIGLVHDGQYFWMSRFLRAGLADRELSFVRWDISTGRTTEFKKLPNGLHMDVTMFESIHLGGLTKFENRLLAFPLKSNTILEIYTKSGDVYEFDTGLGVDFSKRGGRIFPKWGSVYPIGLYGQFKENILFAITNYDYSLLIINGKTGKTDKIKLRAKGDSHKAALTNISRFCHNGVYGEHMFFSIERFIDAFVSGEIMTRNESQAAYHKSQIENTDGTCGQKIHDYVMASAGKK